MESQTGTIVSIQVGVPKEYRNETGDSFMTGIFKLPVAGPVQLTQLGLEGDGQADLVHHGGPDRVVLMVNEELVAKWGSKHAFVPESGAFGENLTIMGLDADSVCLGDIWETERVALEVSQPRLPCSKLGIRLNRPQIVGELMQACEGGWYCRALEPGSVEPGDTLRLVSRRTPELTIRRAFSVFVYERNGRDQLEALGKVEALSQLWKDQIAKILSKPG